MQGSHVAEIPM